MKCFLFASAVHADKKLEGFIRRTKPHIMSISIRYEKRIVLILMDPRNQMMEETNFFESSFSLFQSGHVKLITRS